MASAKEALGMVIAAVCLAVGLTVGHNPIEVRTEARSSSPDCTAGNVVVDESSIGHPGGAGVITESNSNDCADWSEQAEFWITSISSTIWCTHQASAGGSSWCYKFGKNGTTAGGIFMGSAFYGTYEGNSKGWWIYNPNSGWTAMDPQISQGPLRAGTTIIYGDPDWCANENYTPTEDELAWCYENGYSPIIIPLGRGAEYKLTSAQGGVVFDLNADGTPEQVAWTEADSELAFLALDRNNNGKIDDGSELFGDHTVAGSPNGFDALEKLAMQVSGGELKTGTINADEPIFAKLLLWQDRNHNGVSEASEVTKLSDSYLSDIGLGYKVVGRRDRFGNKFRYQGFAHVRTGPGKNSPRSPQEDQQRVLPIYDVFLTYLKQ